MPMAFGLDEECRECGKEELVWWSKDETERHMEVYMQCRGCGYDYPKQVVSKEDDTSDSALKQEVLKLL